MRECLVVTLVLLSAVLGGCLSPVFKHPLPKINGSEISDCSGVWETKKDKAVLKMVLAPHKQKGWISTKLSGWYDLAIYDEKGPKKTNMSCYATRVGKWNILCFPRAKESVLKRMKANGKNRVSGVSKGYHFAYYKVDGNNMEFAFFQNKETRELIAKGLLEPADMGEDEIGVANSAKEIAALLKNHGVETFVGKDIVTFQRNSAGN